MKNASPNRRFTVPSVFLCTLLLFGCITANSFAASAFTGLDSLPGGSNSFARAISADGNMVVGDCIAASKNGFGNREAFRWTATEGMVGLGLLPGSSSSHADAVSADGSVIVGAAEDFSKTGNPRAFRWTKAGGMTGLENKPSGKKATWARGVSGNGSVIVGRCEGPGVGGAFRWTAATGTITLGKLGDAMSVSSDGLVVIGAGVIDSVGQACRWIEAGGILGLGLLKGYAGTSATVVSADGSVVAGLAIGRGWERVEAFRWTANGDMIGLGSLSGLVNSEANAISKDGSIVMGVSYTYPHYEAFIWDSVNGMRNLQSVLTSGYKLNLKDWTLTGATGISADGKTIVGNGQRNGQFEAWVAHLDRPLNAPAGKERGK